MLRPLLRAPTLALSRRERDFFWRNHETASCISRSRSTTSSAPPCFYEKVLGFKESKTEKVARPYLAPPLPTA